MGNSIHPAAPAQLPSFITDRPKNRQLMLADDLGDGNTGCYLIERALDEARSQAASRELAIR